MECKNGSHFELFVPLKIICKDNCISINKIGMAGVGWDIWMALECV